MAALLAVIKLLLEEKTIKNCSTALLSALLVV